MKRIFSAVALLAVLGCSSQDSKVQDIKSVATPTLSSEQMKRQKQEKIAKEKAVTNEKARIAAESRRKAKEEAASIAKQKSLLEKLVVKDLGTYQNIGMDWHNIQVAHKISNSELTELARYYHKENPNDNYQFWRDDSQFEAYKNWDVNYPDSSYPYPEDWTDKYLAGVVRRSGDQWKLTNASEEEIGSLE